MPPIKLYKMSAIKAAQAVGKSASLIRLLQVVTVGIREIGTPRTSVSELLPGQNAGYCPFIKRGSELDRIWLGVSLCQHPDTARQEMIDFIKQFLSIEPTDDFVYRSAVIVFPNFLDHEPQFRDMRINLAIEHYLPEGLMIGAFFNTQKNENTGESWVVPMLVVRFMVPDDKTFFLKEQDPGEFASAKAAYERRFSKIMEPNK